MGVAGGDGSWGFLATVRPFLQNLRFWRIIAESSAEDEYDLIGAIKGSLWLHIENGLQRGRVGWGDWGQGDRCTW